MDETQEHALIDAAKCGDKQAFNQLAACYRPLVYQYAMQWIGDHDKAEDATQNALIYAWEHISKYNYFPGKFKFWLRTVTRYRVKEICRGYDSSQEKRIRRRMKKEQHLDRDCSQQWEQEELARRQQPDPLGILSALTPRQRRVVELFNDGLRPDAIAAELGISRSTVWVHLSGARKRIALTNKDKSKCTPLDSSLLVREKESLRPTDFWWDSYHEKRPESSAVEPLTESSLLRQSSRRDDASTHTMTVEEEIDFIWEEGSGSWVDDLLVYDDPCGGYHVWQ